MGSCLSSSSSKQPLSQLTAKVISLNGSLRQYSINLTVSEILELESAQSSSSCFMCNSDSLCYNEFIQPLSPKEEIEMGEIYFILPLNRLKSRLSASDMAALAVKASLAIGNKEGSGSGRRRGQPLRVSPVLDVNQRFYGDEKVDGGIKKRFEQKPMVNGITRSGSVRKLQRNASKRAKMAIRSFRTGLSTIHEGIVAAV